MCILQETDLYAINDQLRKFFLIFPQYCLGRGLIDMTRNQLVADAFAVFGEDVFENPFNWDLVGKNMFCLGIQGVIFFAFTLGLEYGFFVKKLPCFKSE
jgi:ATP-binding cassette subfamily A (ABC1) protein 1